MTREEAIAWGRKLAEDEARRRGEVGALRDERVKRAERYAAWDYDGRPTTGTPQPVSFEPRFKK